MSLRKRQTLSNYFRAGSLPLEHHFHDLIDSTLNMVDDGFSKSPESGFNVAALGTHDGLLSFSRDSNPRDTLWSVSYVNGSSDLCVRSPTVDAPVMTFATSTGEEFASTAIAGAQLVRQNRLQGRVGINTAMPSSALDVCGVIRCEGRIGATANGLTKVPADGKWQSITGSLDGCHALEVMAGVGNPREGRYALMRAYAHNVFNPRGWLFNFLNLKRRVRYDQSYFRSRADKIRLRWSGDNHDYRLQLRTTSDYGEGIVVRFYITQLWFDPAMTGSKPKPASGETGA